MVYSSLVTSNVDDALVDLLFGGMPPHKRVLKKSCWSFILSESLSGLPSSVR